MTNDQFLDLYKRFLEPNGLFRLKTDSPFLYEYTLQKLTERADFEVLNHTNDLYNSDLLSHHYGIETHYEKLWVEKGYTINYISARVIK